MRKGEEHCIRFVLKIGLGACVVRERKAEKCQFMYESKELDSMHVTVKYKTDSSAD